MITKLNSTNKIKEAIDFLNKFKNDRNDNNELIIITKKALKKQLSQKVEKCTWENSWACPRCHTILLNSSKKSLFCEYCGQRLDWKE